MPRAMVNGVEHAYEVTGVGQAVLFIHGGYGGAPTTLVNDPGYVHKLLDPARYQSITYDRRNCRLSGYVLEHFTLEDLAEDARALLDHLHVEQAIVVGTSAGGPIAEQLALSHPERIHALCLTDTSSYLMNPERPASKAMADLVARSKAEGDRALFESRKQELRNAAPLPPYVASRPGATERHEQLKQALATVSDEDLFRLSTGEIRNYEAYLPYDLTSRLSELKMTTAVMHGTADSRVPFAWGQKLHAGIAGASFHAVEGADHGLLGYDNGAAEFRRWVDAVIGMSA